MKELQMIYLQQEHIKRLQEKLTEQKKSFIDSFVRTPGWAEFLLKHSKTYFRPKGGTVTLKDAIRGGKFGIEFPDKDMKYVQIAVGYSGHGINFRSASILIKEIEEFIEENKDKRDNQQDGGDYNSTSWWYNVSPYNYTVI